MEQAPEDLLEALLAVLDELPRLLGPACAGPYLRLERIAARLQAGAAPGGWLARELEEAFQDHPRARARFWEAIRARGRPQGRSEGAVRTRGGGVKFPVGGLGPAPAGQALQDLTGRLRGSLRQAARRYADVSCPERVSVRAPRVSVVVRLTVAAGDYAAAAEALGAREGRPVRVRVAAPNFQVLGAAEQETMVLPDVDSPPLVFDLRPLRVGPARVTLDFFQQGGPLGTVTVPIECTPAEDGEPAPRRPAALRVAAYPTPPDLVLHIATLPAPPALEFTLSREGGGWWRTFPPVPLQADAAGHADALYRHLTGITVRSDPASAAHDGYSARVLTGPQVDRGARELGQNLWKDLVPRELKDLYAAEREGWRGRSLLVLSDDPHLPWELVWPYGDGWQDEAPWCATLGLTRWLRRDALGNGNEGPPTELPLRCLAVLAPTDTDLPTALAERDFLRGLAARHRLRDLSPEPTTVEAVLGLLEGGQYDWLHVASHGKFHAAAPDADSVVWLQGRAALTPHAFVGPDIEGHLRRRRPAFVFNACEVGRLGRGLTGLAGWATRLVGAGAGLFAAPLWEVTDDGALAFVRGLYERLLAGETVAEAVRQARRGARREGDPTWLAYSVYAHPNARLAPPAEA
jgi:hypothetical protein